MSIEAIIIFGITRAMRNGHILEKKLLLYMKLLNS